MVHVDRLNRRSVTVGQRTCYLGGAGDILSAKGLTHMVIPPSKVMSKDDDDLINPKQEFKRANLQP